MSLRQYLIKQKTKSGELDNALDSLLPDPNVEKDAETAKTVTVANSSVKDVLQSPNRKRKRGEYSNYSSEQRAKIARYACEHGNTSAAKHFSKLLDKTINESTVRSMKKQYIDELNKTPEKKIVELSRSPKGRPKLLGKYDEEVVDYVKKLRATGAIVNKQILIACATGILEHKCRSMLQENGGHIALHRSWAESFLRRIGFVKRKGTKAARKVPANFDELRVQFLASVSKIISENNIPEELVMNFDQTNISIIPCGNWTMEEEGSKQVEITGLEDKHQITALLTCTMAGNLLPPQLLYQGKTDQCHPPVKFPKGWDIHHSENHWSNEQTMLRFIDTILLPYIHEQRDRLNLPLKQPALAIFDVFAAHRVESFINKLQKAGILIKYVPGGCTGELQPLDLSGNSQIKEVVKSCFTAWYAQQVGMQLKAGKTVKNVEINLKLSNIKPIHANWIIQAIQKVKDQKGVIRNGWVRSGMLTVDK
ncbi:Hypothetical predicted protein [Mytilus galloprovincialis]|uniref:DDE-1 domain-containing protein n=1 Tax=Mytilus galloprovincialis TaxID=29158 RepID=A0A8B6CHX0_MYTGA|nr:Hypothetical predicted protein [Mytilus galloprovincialis]